MAPSVAADKRIPISVSVLGGALHGLRDFGPCIELTPRQASKRNILQRKALDRYMPSKLPHDICHALNPHGASISRVGRAADQGSLDHRVPLAILTVTAAVSVQVRVRPRQRARRDWRAC